jgi:hypothetical protein
VLDFTDALMGYGALSAWVQEVSPGGSADRAEPEPGAGDGKLWLKAAWHECKVVALFGIQQSQARLGPDLIRLLMHRELDGR